MCLNSGHPSYVFKLSKHQTMGSKRNLRSKSGMNGHPTSPFDTRIEPPASPMNWPGFYGFKTMKYRLQERLMSEKPSQHFFSPFFRGVVFSHPWGPLGPNIFFPIFSTSKHSPGVPGDPRGSPGDPRGSPGAQGVTKTMNNTVRGPLPPPYTPP